MIRKNNNADTPTAILTTIAVFEFLVLGVLDVAVEGEGDGASTLGGGVKGVVESFAGAGVGVFAGSDTATVGVGGGAGGVWLECGGGDGGFFPMASPF